MKNYAVALVLVCALAFFSFEDATQSREVSHKVEPGDTVWSLVSPYCKDADQLQYFVYETSRKNGGAMLHAGDTIILIVPEK